MATDVSNNFLDKLRKHYETGVSLKHMNLTEEQKRRVEVCMDAYKRFVTDPFMDLQTYLKNRWQRTFSEIKNDMKTINYISSFYNEGERQVSAARVRHAAVTAMRAGADSGDLKSMLGGASLLMKLDRLDQPEARDLDESMAAMPLVITTDASRKYKNKKHYDEEAMKRIRKKYGAKQDHWQEMVESKTGEYVSASEPDDGEEEEMELYEEEGEE